MEHRTERVVLETDKHRIVGTLTLPREGYRSRLSDYLNQGDLEYISLIDAVITPLDGRPEENRPFVGVALGHVRVIYPVEEA